MTDVVKVERVPREGKVVTEILNKFLVLVFILESDLYLGDTIRNLNVNRRSFRRGW